MSFSYDKTSVLEPAGERKFYHTFENQWLNESGGPLGSMIIAVTLKAILAVTKPLGKPHPVSLYSNFFASPSAGQRVEIEVTIQKDGRAFCFAEGKVYIPSKKNPGSLDLAFCAQGAFSNLAPDARLPIFSSRPMAIPYYKLSPYPTSTGKAPAECVSVYDLIKEDLFAPFYLNFQMLVDKDAVEDVLKQTKAKMAAGFVDDMMDASYGDIWIGDTDQRPIDYEALASECPKTKPRQERSLEMRLNISRFILLPLLRSPNFYLNRVTHLHRWSLAFSLHGRLAHLQRKDPERIRQKRHARHVHGLGSNSLHCSYSGRQWSLCSCTSQCDHCVEGSHGVRGHPLGEEWTANCGGQADRLDEEIGWRAGGFCCGRVGQEIQDVRGRMKKEKLLLDYLL